MTSIDSETFVKTAKFVKHELHFFTINIQDPDHFLVSSIISTMLLAFLGLLFINVMVINGLLEEWGDFDHMFSVLIALFECFIFTFKYLSYISLRKKLQKSCKWLYEIHKNHEIDIINHIAQEVMELFSSKCILRIKYVYVYIKLHNYLFKNIISD